MKYEHAEFLSCVFGGTALMSALCSSFIGAIFGAIFGAVVAIYAIYNRKKVIK